MQLFKKGIRRDPSLFPTIKRDEEFQSWSKDTITQARAQGVDEVLDKDYIPITSDHVALFEEKQKYMMGVFQKTLLSTKGKSLMRKYHDTSNAQKVYEGYAEHCLHSTKADNECSQIYEFLLTTRATEWTGPMYDFIAYMKEQMESYNEKSDPEFTDAQQQKFIEKAVNGIPTLKAIKTTAQQIAFANNKVLTFDKYLALLEQAALDYDIEMGHTSTKAPRQLKSATRWGVYASDQINDDPYNVNELAIDDTYDDYIDIDTPLYLVQQCMQTTNMPTEHNCLPAKVFYDLDTKDLKTWNQLPDESKDIILYKPPKPPNLPTGKSHKICFTDNLGNNDTAYEAFSVGRLLANTEVQHMQQSNDNNNKEENIYDITDKQGLQQGNKQKKKLQQTPTKSPQVSRYINQVFPKFVKKPPS